MHRQLHDWLRRLPANVQGALWLVSGGFIFTCNGVMIRLVVKTRPSQQYRVSRELRARLKTAFEREGIEIPFPQQMVWNRSVGSAS